MIKKKSKFIAAWNILNLLDTNQNNITLRKTPLVSLELLKYNIDTSALSETYLSENVVLKNA